jgi:hypothetical protein
MRLTATARVLFTADRGIGFSGSGFFWNIGWDIFIRKVIKA